VLGVAGVGLLVLAAVLAEEADLVVAGHFAGCLSVVGCCVGGWENTFHLAREKDFNFL
jgi:hypothetical protein